MLNKIVGSAFSLSLLGLAFALASSDARASDPRKVWGNTIEACPHCHSCLSKDVFYSEFYGYYRTCWRRWPGGQPPCPNTEVVSEAPQPEPAKPAPENVGPTLPELLPTPKIEPEKR